MHLSCILIKFFVLSLCPFGLNSSICWHAHIGNIIVGMNRGIFDFWQFMMFMMFHGVCVPWDPITSLGVRRRRKRRKKKGDIDRVRACLRDLFARKRHGQAFCFSIARILGGVRCRWQHLTGSATSAESRKRRDKQMHINVLWYKSDG